jgi:uncharacterized protein YoxC
MSMTEERLNILEQEHVIIMARLRMIDANIEEHTQMLLALTESVKGLTAVVMGLAEQMHDLITAVHEQGERLDRLTERLA